MTFSGLCVPDRDRPARGPVRGLSPARPRRRPPGRPPPPPPARAATGSRYRPPRTRGRRSSSNWCRSGIPVGTSSIRTSLGPSRSRCESRAPQRVAVSDDERGVPGSQLGDQHVVPVRQQPGDDVGEALGPRHVGGVEVGVARVGEQAGVGIVAARRRRAVTGAAPGAVGRPTHLGPDVGADAALKRAVGALVQPPGAVHRDVGAPGRPDGDVPGAQRAHEQRRVQHRGDEPGLAQQVAGVVGPPLPEGRQVDVHPAGEPARRRSSRFRRGAAAAGWAPDDPAPRGPW